jgi:signal transduction histidine kinase
METVAIRWLNLRTLLALFAPRLLVLFVGVLLFSPFPGAQQLKPIRRVLVLNDLGFVSSPGFAEVDQAIFAGLQKSPYQIELYFESLELSLFPEEDAQRQFREAFIRKYSDRKPDLIVAAGSGSLQFVAGFHEGLFRNTPIVFCAVLGDIPDGLQADSHITGVFGTLHPRETLTTALQLLPGTRQVVVVGGAGNFDKSFEDIAKQGFQNFESKLKFTYLTDLTMPVLLERLQHLPNDAIIYHTAITQDGAGNRFVDSAQALPMVTSAANVPVFVMDDVDLRAGALGGDLVNWADDARIAAEMAVRVLNGERPQDMPAVTSNHSYMFDWRALHRWGIKESALPQGSVVLFREPTLWERTKWFWLASLAIILSLAGLVAYLHYSRLQLQLARDAEMHLSGMVINAQEKERSRLAAELHDDFGQRLALLIVGLEDAAESLPPSAAETKRKLDELTTSVGDLGDDLHTLSHRLHSATLDKLGLVTGMRALCEEFTARHGIDVSFCSDGVPRNIQSDVALCLFRIAQESLQNIKKHSGVSKAQVRLRQIDDSLLLSVKDEGKGFPTEEMKQQPGLGLRSMEGRALMLGGRLRIRSEEGKGTRVEAIVPLAPACDRQA